MGFMSQTLFDEYSATFSPIIQKLLQTIKNLVYELAPTAQEVMSYGIPTFDVAGKHLVHVAVFKNHLGIFPGSAAIAHFQRELQVYKISKGTIQLPLDKPVPQELLKKILDFRLQEIKREMKKKNQN